MALSHNYEVPCALRGQDKPGRRETRSWRVSPPGASSGGALDICLAKNFRFDLVGDGEILKGWGQRERTLSGDPDVGKKTPPSSYLSMNEKYRK